MLVDRLKHNLLSICQLGNKGNIVIFDKSSCTIESIIDNKILFIDQRVENVYILKLDDIASLHETCLATMNDNSWLWHRRLGHAHIDLNSKLAKRN